MNLKKLVGRSEFMYQSSRKGREMDSSMGKVLTVIVPVYNMEKYIRQCLESLVIGEALDRIEVLVALDSSKDGSAEIAYEFVEQYPDTFRIIYKANGGHGSAITTGLMMASGEYVKILDSDDWVERDAFCRLVDCLETEGTELARQVGGRSMKTAITLM